MRLIPLAALAVLAGAAACTPQAPGSPSARGAYPVTVSNTGGQSCYLRYQKRRDVPVTEVGYVRAGEKLDFVVRDPDSRSLGLYAECGRQHYVRQMRLVTGETLELVVPSMFTEVQRPTFERAPAGDSAVTNRRPGAR